MASAEISSVDFSSLSLYKSKPNAISNLQSQIERRQETLKRQKEKREQIVSQLRFATNDNESMESDKAQGTVLTEWPPRQHRRNPTIPCPIGMMLAEWLFSIPEDISSWFVIPCPLGQRCLIVVHSHKTYVYGKSGNFMWTMFTKLPKHSILYCIYDSRSSIYYIVDLIMWNGQDYSTQVECQCRFFMLMSLDGDPRLNGNFQLLPRTTLESQHDLTEAEDGYLFYHPLGFYETGYSPLVCWLKPFMIQEILGIKFTYPISKPDGYTTAQAYMFEEQSNRKERPFVEKSHRKKKQKQDEDLMSVD